MVCNEQRRRHYIFDLRLTCPGPFWEESARPLDLTLHFSLSSSPVRPVFFV
jgi:hypothetical protein